MTYIYSLVDPRTNKIRYVGKTNHLSIRYSAHITCFSGFSHRVNWLRQLHTLNLKPIMNIIEECGESNWQEREQYWIRYYRELGYDLVNTTNGGEGQCGNKSWLGKKHKDSSKLKMSVAAKGSKRHIQPHSEETKELLQLIGRTVRHTALLREEDVREIRYRINNKEKLADIAKDYGVSYTAIHDIKSRRKWAWLE